MAHEPALTRRPKSSKHRRWYRVNLFARETIHSLPEREVSPTCAEPKDTEGDSGKRCTELNRAHGNNTRRYRTTFMDLPVELRTMIWKACLPIRIVEPWDVRMYGMERTRTQWAYPLIEQVCRDARDTIEPHVTPFPSVEAHHVVCVCGLIELGSNGPFTSHTVWGHAPTTLVRLTYYIYHYLQRAPKSWPLLDETLALARRPEQSLILSIDMLSDNVYQEYIKPKKHIFIECLHLSLEYSDRKSWTQLARSGFFGIFGEEPALINLNDKAKVTTVIEMLERISGEARYGSSWEVPAFRKLVDGEYGREPNKVVVKFLHALLEEVCAASIPDINWTVESPLLDAHGRLDGDHRVVKKLDLSLPDWTPVVVLKLEPYERLGVQPGMDCEEEAQDIEGPRDGDDAECERFCEERDAWWERYDDERERKGRRGHKIRRGVLQGRARARRHGGAQKPCPS